MRRFIVYLPEALESIWANRTRSILSILGMVIGVAAVIAVLGLSQAAANGIKSEISQGGDPGLLIFVDRTQNVPAIATLYYRDVARVQSYASPEIDRAIPLYNQRPVFVKTSGRKESITLYSTEAIKHNGGLVMLAGRLLDQNDVQAAARVGILSKSAAERLFPVGDAVGRSINVGTDRLVIVGVFSLSGSLFNSAVGDSIYIPYTTAHRILPGPIDYIQFWPAPGVTPVAAIDAARQALGRIHRGAQYNIQDQAGALAFFEKLLTAIGVGLTSIGGIALFVAGVGIMNITLVSVTERTHEIGIRKAIGASAADISIQFLIEATLLSLIGGLIGTGVGVAAVLLGQGVIEKTVGAAPVPWGPVISIALGFSLAVGVCFGSYPAARAGRLHPVEALRS